MNRGVHMAVGAAAGGDAYLVVRRIQKKDVGLGEFVLCAAAGAAVACLPDILEPALHPRHRAVAHSLVANGTLVIGMRKLWLCENLSADQKLALTVLGCAYLSHPLIDANTPMGLPLLGIGGI